MLSVALFYQKANARLPTWNINIKKIGDKVSITIKGPLGAQKEKKLKGKKKKKIKTIETPRERVQKASKQVEPNRIL